MPRGAGRPPAAARQAGGAAPPPRPAAELPLSHPAFLAAAVVAAGCVLLSVSFKLSDTDMWQHIAVGREIWRLHAVPTQQIWTWPTYGAPAVTPSWAFRALIWPIWAAAGVPGLFAWRWLTTLAAFALLWATARRMGARGLTSLVVLVVCSLVYRIRSEVRPETLVAVLFALELWILETRRAGGPDRTRWLAAIGWVWANVHISFPLGLVLLALHDAGGALRAWSGARRPRGRAASRAAARGTPTPAVTGGTAPPLRRDALTALATVALWFVNPSGSRAVAQPFEYFLVWRHESIFKTVLELGPVDWRENWTNGLPLLVVGWPLLILWRARRRTFDGFEALLAATLFGLALPTQRFTGFLALGAAPYVARDLEAYLRARRWPSWTSPAPARALLAVVACVASGLAEWSRPEMTPGVGLRLDYIPVRACDFMSAHGVRGHGYNDYWLGGYLLWRFWPQRDRLPFMDIHQTGTREDRWFAAALPIAPSVWARFDRRHAFDYALLSRNRVDGDFSQDALDADTSFALVFMDDAASLYVRRSGPFAGVADSFAYRVIPAGPTGVRRLTKALEADKALRALAGAELERSIQASDFNGVAHLHLAHLRTLEGRYDESRAESQAALAHDGFAAYAWERLAANELSEGRPRAALAALAHEGRSPVLREVRARLRFEALAELRELGTRRAELAAALRQDPARRDLADSLAAVERRLAP